MDRLTISEGLFEQFCEENGIRYLRIGELGHKTPDYEVYFGERLVITEVKEFNPNDEDRRREEELRAQGKTALWEESGRRVRKKIEDSREQFKERSKGRYPTLLVLYDNVPIGSLDFDDVRIAMYGELTATWAAPSNPEQEPFVIDKGFGRNAKFASTRNTTFSALAVLYKSGGKTLHLSIFHNYFAKNPINPAWLRRDTVKHLSLDPTAKGVYPIWKEV